MSSSGPPYKTPRLKTFAQETMFPDAEAYHQFMVDIHRRDPIETVLWRLRDLLMTGYENAALACSDPCIRALLESIHACMPGYENGEEESPYAFAWQAAYIYAKLEISNTRKATLRIECCLTDDPAIEDCVGIICIDFNAAGISIGATTDS